MSRTLTHKTEKNANDNVLSTEVEENEKRIMFCRQKLFALLGEADNLQTTEKNANEENEKSIML